MDKDNLKDQPDKRRITVRGSNEQDVLFAIEEINIQRVLIPIENHLVDHVRGKNDSNLEFFFNKASLKSINIEKPRQEGG